MTSDFVVDDIDRSIVEQLRMNGRATNQQIADRLGLTVPTVKWHLYNLYAKLQVKSRAAALANLRRDTAMACAAKAKSPCAYSSKPARRTASIRASAEARPRPESTGRSRARPSLVSSDPYGLPWPDRNRSEYVTPRFDPWSNSSSRGMLWPGFSTYSPLT